MASLVFCGSLLWHKISTRCDPGCRVPVLDSCAINLYTNRTSYGTRNHYRSADLAGQRPGLIIEYAVNIAAALLTLLVGYIAANILSGGVVRVMQTRKLDATVTHFVGSILKYTILVFVVIAALGRVGVQTASFVAIIGAAGLAIGLALQGSLSNFAAGFLLIIFRPSRRASLLK